MQTNSLTEFNRRFPTLHQTDAKGELRTQASDFKVTELMDIDWSDSGEHLWLWVEKTGCNTAWAAQQLAAACGVSPRAVGYAGLKDRHAVTCQWFSVQLPQQDSASELQRAMPEGIRILEARRHHRKLKTGALRGNRFELLVKQVQAEQEQVDTTIARIATHGVPNYFGEQRFGHELSNIARASAWFSGEFRPRDKKLRGLLLSAARSWIFNHIVAERIRTDTFLSALPGDIFQLQGSRSWFQEDDQEQIKQRLQQQDIHITAALWGDGQSQTSDQAAELETTVANQFPELQAGLQQQRVQPDRRSMRLLVSDLQHDWQADSLALSFALPAGSYATTVVREILRTGES